MRDYYGHYLDRKMDYGPVTYSQRRAEITIEAGGGRTVLDGVEITGIDYVGEDGQIEGTLDFEADESRFEEFPSLRAVRPVEYTGSFEIKSSAELAEQLFEHVGAGEFFGPVDGEELDDVDCEACESMTEIHGVPVVESRGLQGEWYEVSATVDEDGYPVSIPTVREGVEVMDWETGEPVPPAEDDPDPSENPDAYVEMSGVE